MVIVEDDIELIGSIGSTGELSFNTTGTITIPLIGTEAGTQRTDIASTYVDTAWLPQLQQAVALVAANESNFSFPFCIEKGEK